MLVRLVFTEVPLTDQFLEPGRPIDTMQPPNVYVAAAVNLIVPNGPKALAPQFTINPANLWTAGRLESDSYIPPATRRAISSVPSSDDESTARTISCAYSRAADAHCSSVAAELRVRPQTVRWFRIAMGLP